MGKARGKVGVCKHTVGTWRNRFCCFTPALVVLLSAVGLSAAIGWLDYVLLPALAVFTIVTVLAFVAWRRCN